MKHFEAHWQSRDGLELFSQRWEPEAGVKGVVCLVHGLGEHSSRYTHVAEFLTQAGYAVSAFDLRGHGKSAGQRGHTPNFEAIMEDIDLLIEDADRHYPGRPCFLYGHSLGGILVLNYALRRKPGLAGVIATGPGLRSSLEQQTLKLAIVRGVGAVLPTFTLPTGLNPKLICRDPEVVEDYMHDPLVHDRATLGWARNILEAIPWVFEHAVEFSTPLLLMHGDSDELAFPQGSREFSGLVHCECTIKLWPGLSHEIHNEPEKGEVLAFLLEWLEMKRESDA